VQDFRKALRHAGFELSDLQLDSCGKHSYYLSIPDSRVKVPAFGARKVVSARKKKMKQPERKRSIAILEFKCAEGSATTRYGHGKTRGAKIED